MAEQPSNGRVTMAVLSHQITTLTGEVNELRKLLTNVAVLDSEMKTVRDDVGELEKRINGWSSVNSLGVLGAAIIGLFFGPKQ